MTACLSTAHAPTLLAQTAAYKAIMQYLAGRLHGVCDQPEPLLSQTAASRSRLLLHLEAIMQELAACAQVCDQPHPLLVAEVVRHCQAAALDEAWKGLEVC